MSIGHLDEALIRERLGRARLARVALSTASSP
jgi:hypothetical protein